MKSFNRILICMALIIGISACGKKASVNGKEIQKSFQPSEAEKSVLVDKQVKLAVQTNNLTSLEALLRNNPSVDVNQLSDDGNGDTLLTLAIRRDFRDIRNFLIEQGANLEEVNLNKETPLIVAVIANRLNSVQVLLDNRVDMNRKDSNEETALHRAIILQGTSTLVDEVRKSYEDIALLLIKEGANIEITNKQDKTPYRLAQDHHADRVVELIKSIIDVTYGNPDINTFRNLLTNGDVRNLSAMLSRYPNMVLIYESINPLVIAMDIQDEMDALRSVQILLNYKASASGPVNAEVTPLIKATKLQKRSYMQMFIDAKANVNAFDSNGKSALYHAIDLTNSELVDMLLANQARKNNATLNANACSIARSVERRGLDQKGKDSIKAIKKSLGCWL